MELLAVQSSVEQLVCELHGCGEVRNMLDSVGYKEKGCLAAPPHLDRNRLNTFQVLIAVTKGSWRVWPGFHLYSFDASVTTAKASVNVSKHTEFFKHHEAVDIRCEPGDVLVMRGGELVHPVPATDDTRIMAYAYYKPVESKVAGRKGVP